MRAPAMAARLPAVLSLLVLCLSSCSASRSLLLATAPLAAQDALLAPAAAQEPVLPLNPALAPGLAASGPLPEGVVSLAAKKNTNQVAAQDALAAAQATPETTQTGQYSVVAGNQNTDKGLLPAGNSVNTKKLSASQLASVQAANNVNAQRLIAADVTKVVGANVQLDSSGQPSEVKVNPTDMAARTVNQVNSDAPTYTAPNGLAIKPQLATGSQKALAAPSGSASGSKSNADAAKTRTTTAAGQPLNAVQGTSALDGEVITGDYVGAVVGVRIATPFFGTGFNFCIDRYFGSFPKVGIVIPNAAAWLLPEFQDLAQVLEHTLDLPTILPHGARIDPTADGFLLWLPTFQPSQVPDFGLRYGIQIGQAFGYDFGIGIIRDICFVSFVIV
ncbi:hypothetical protein COCSUDRAFT_58887 [Coccomyxa subellipsoidea C-169]|uniref:Uncharacterized protein n=1 Tax=Coccomyxa subellipsoidea (strain C-169) TaxID=574566 RepID=I0Z6T1_COCSC|nr:hypothetical protein COCSUDRAFT_58887 [Coccomyxa subellipsoidea C-169]EIE26350.1 hypothetical protein COCSUDRAFT_58887 [Coccomyxa subellipsoidea C-169]|eukprot:XP_005650894.1 hypothetical protein COCSUDRAFT_58887 [Coccomyxa subellipsoidea C-169]